MEIFATLGLMSNMKSRIVIFESGISDGIMSNNRKFYPKNWTQEKIDETFLEKRIKFGKKHSIDGTRIYRATQKNTINKLEYPDGQYLILDPNATNSEDAWYEKLVADIIIMPYNNKKVALAHQMADCPIMIAEDRRQGVTALSHCGAVYINRLLPQQTIEALQKEYNSNLEDIYVYIGSCAHKENYIYDTYPKWATNKDVWQDAIIKIADFYHIDMPKAIAKQLNRIGIKNLTISDKDTITDSSFYSHAGNYQGLKKENGQNIVGFYYEEF